jgi:hypothetical protein
MSGLDNFSIENLAPLRGAEQRRDIARSLAHTRFNSLGFPLSLTMCLERQSRAGEERRSYPDGRSLILFFQSKGFLLPPLRTDFFIKKNQVWFNFAMIQDVALNKSAHIGRIACFHPPCPISIMIFRENWTTPKKP